MSCLNSPQKPTEVRWIDTCVSREAWEDKEEAPEDKLLPLECYSLGYVYENTEDYITLVADLNRSQVGRKITIPKCSIASIKYL